MINEICNYRFSKHGNLYANFRTFTVKFLGATDFRGERVKITDTRHKQSKILSYDYQMGNIAEQSITWLENNLGINIIGFSHNDTKNNTYQYIVMTDNFDKTIK